jgi:hypothetical protein
MLMGKLCSTVLVRDSVREVSLPAKQALIVDILLRKGGVATGYDIVKASDGELTLGGVYTHLNRLEGKGIIESDYSVTEDAGHRMPKRKVRLRAGVARKEEGATEGPQSRVGRDSLAMAAAK